jgi:AcrR family transcriptional regulator
MSPMAKPQPRGRRGLNRSDLLEAAFTLASEEGEAGFSLRKLGARLGVDPMTLLHHFGSKEGLLREIADYSLKTVSVPEPTENWQQDLRDVAAAYRDLAHRHPRLFHLHFRYHATGARDHAASEVVHRALRRAGFADSAAAGLGLTFFAFVLGFALAETEGLMQPLSKAEEAELDALDPVAFAVTRDFVPAFKALDADQVFLAAIEVLVAGFAARAGAQ